MDLCWGVCVKSSSYLGQIFWDKMPQGTGGYTEKQVLS